MSTHVTPLRMLDVIATSDCNLRCSYCYQNAKRPGVMTWATLRPALDLLMKSSEETVQVYFVGGEPLLAFDLIERAVGYANAHKPARLGVRYALSTNGVALGRREARFLAAKRFHVKLSFDGVRSLQAIRARGTFDALDHLLDDLRLRHPAMFASRLNVGVTLVPEGIPSLAATVRYLLGKQVADFYVAPAMLASSRWSPALRRDLRAQFEEVRDACLAHFRSTGKVPLRWLRRSSAGDGAAALPDWYCGIGTGTALTVDVDGRLHGCVTLASSYQHFPASRLGRAVARLRLGTLGDLARPGRIAAYHRAISATGLFNHRSRKFSSYGRCSRCRSRFRCVICPAAILHAGGDDPNRVPDFVCAFNRLAADTARRFPCLPDGEAEEGASGSV